jgi:hypothetical protein
VKKNLVFKFAVLIIISALAITYSVNTAMSEEGVTKVKLQKAESKKTVTVSNNMFSVALPNDAKGSYSVYKKHDAIHIFDKASKKSGYGGYAFGVIAYKNPADHAMMPGGRKLGELVDKKGTIYDMVLSQPTDVQFDYVNGKSASYDILYNAGENISSNIKGINGSVYYNERGMKGKDLYKDILSKHIKAVKEKWNSSKLEKEDMSYMYNVLAQSNKNVMNKIGYTYFDVNGDGIEELLIGEISNDSWKGVVYDIYTMVDRKPAHVISGGTRNRYYVCDDAFICNEYSSGAKESGQLVYTLVENSTELFPQVGFKYDGYKNPKKPWFISYDFKADKWESVTENKYKERKAVFDRYERFIYTPLSKYSEK